MMNDHIFRAIQALSLLLVPPLKMDDGGAPECAIDFFDQKEIYPGTIRPLPRNVLG